MSRSALSVDEHFQWMLCHLETLRIITVLAATTNDVARFSHFAEFRGFVLNISNDVRAHATAARAAIRPEVAMQEAPWV